MELCSCFEFSQHNPRHEAQSEDPCDHTYKKSVSPNLLQCERNTVTPVRKRTCDVAEKRYFMTKVSYKNFFVLVWTKLNTTT